MSLAAAALPLAFCPCSSGLCGLGPGPSHRRSSTRAQAPAARRQKRISRRGRAVLDRSKATIGFVRHRPEGWVRGRRPRALRRRPTLMQEGALLFRPGNPGRTGTKPWPQQLSSTRGKSPTPLKSANHSEMLCFHAPSLVLPGERRERQLQSEAGRRQERACARAGTQLSDWLRGRQRRPGGWARRGADPRLRDSCRGGRANPDDRRECK